MQVPFRAFLSPLRDSEPTTDKMMCSDACGIGVPTGTARLAALDHMLGPAHRVRWVRADDLACRMRFSRRCVVMRLPNWMRKLDAVQRGNYLMPMMKPMG